MVSPKGNPSPSIAIHRVGWLEHLGGYGAVRPAHVPWLHRCIMSRTQLIIGRIPLFVNEMWRMAARVGFVWLESGIRPWSVHKGVLTSSPSPTGKDLRGPSETSVVRPRVLMRGGQADKVESLSPLFGRISEERSMTHLSKVLPMPLHGRDGRRERYGTDSPEPVSSSVQREATVPSNTVNSSQNSIRRNTSTNQPSDKNEGTSITTTDGKEPISRGTPLYPLVQFPQRLPNLNWLVGMSRAATVHIDGHAHTLASRHGADAVTIGRDIYMKYGKFDPVSPPGLALLAHELTHLRQGVESADVAKGCGVIHRQDRLEQEARGVERSVLSVLNSPGNDDSYGGMSLGQPTPPSMEFPRLPAPNASSRMNQETGAPHEGGIGSHGPTTLFRASEGREMGLSGSSDGAAADPQEAAGLALLLLERRLRIDKERYELART